MTPRDETLQVLIESYFDRTATEAEVAELDRRLATHAAAVEQFQEFSALDGLLQSRLTTERQEHAAGDLLAQLHADAVGTASSASQPWATRQLGLWRSPVGYPFTPARLGVYAATASCVCLLVVLAQITLTREQPVPAPAPSVTHVADDLVVESLERCRWWGTTSLQVGQTFRESQELHLTAGEAVFRSKQGARIKVSAPAEFRWRGPEELELSQGRALALVPRAARGFAVETPVGRVIDLGTEFSVGVDAGGRTEVQVAVGVVTFALHAAPEATAQRIEAKHGMISSLDGRQLEHTVFELAQFASAAHRGQPQASTDDDDGRIAYRGARLGLARFRSLPVDVPFTTKAGQRLGSAGYFFFNSADGKNRSGEPFAADALRELPAFIRGIEPHGNEPGRRGSASFDQYLDIDHPRLSGVRINSGAGSVAARHAGESLALLDMTLGDHPPPFCVGVLVNNLPTFNHPAEWNLPEAIQLISSRGDASRIVRVDRSRIGAGDWYFFDVQTAQSGEVLTLRLMASRGRSQAIGGLVFDERPSSATN